MAADLTFDVLALDKASKTFVKMAAQVERLSDKLDKLDRKDVDVEVNVDTNRASRRLRRLVSAVGGAGGKAATAFGIALQGGILRNPKIAAAIGLALAPLLVAGATAAAAVAGTAIVGVFGGALATIGIVAAAQNKKVKKAFTDLKDHVVKETKAMAVPFEGTLIHIADVARRTFDSFAPALRRSFKGLAPTVAVFVDNLGKALEGLKPAIQPMTDAFGAFLRQLGPRLGPLFDKIAESLKKLAFMVKDNAVEMGLFFDLMLQSIPFIIDLAARAVGALAAIVRAAPKIASGILVAVEIVIQGFKLMFNAAVGAAEKILTAMVKAFGWVPGLGPKLQTALAKLQGFKEGANRVFDKAIQKTREWRTALDRMPKVVKLRGRIRDLEQKIDAAKRKLKTVPKSKRSEIRGRIAQLRRQVRAAKRALNSIQDETVNINIMRRTFDLPGTSQSQRLMQHGGPVRAHEAVIVGEKRPELFVPKRDGVILPRVPQRGHGASFGGGGGHVVLEIRSGGSRMDDLLLETLRGAIRKKGGDLDVVFRRGR